jgi:hypothetical protein
MAVEQEATHTKGRGRRVLARRRYQTPNSSMPGRVITDKISAVPAHLSDCFSERHSVEAVFPGDGDVQVEEVVGPKYSQNRRRAWLFVLG